MIRKIPSIVIAILLAIAVVPFAYSQSNSSSNAPVAQAHALLNQGRSAEALALLRPLQMQFAGTHEYDYALGLSLLDSQNYSESALVFERLLANQPGFHGARLDLARAYVAIAQYQKASAELDRLSDTRPPKKAEIQISELRNIIAIRSRTMRLSRYLSVRTSVGYDSNVNSATVIDRFLGFDLDAQSQEQESDFIEAGVDAGLGYQLTRTLSLTTKLGVKHRSNSQASFVDATVVTAKAGLLRQYEDNIQTLSLNAYQLNVDGKTNSRGINLSGLWLRSVLPNWKIGITGELGTIRFGNELSVKDVNRASFGLVGHYVFGPDQRGFLSVRTGFGSDDPQQSASRYARDFIYGSASMSWSFSDTLQSNLFFYYQDSQYDEVFFEQQFSQAREDELYRVAGSLNWQISRHWALTNTLSYTYNDTFVDIFEYEKFEAKLGLNYQFR